MDTHSGLNVLRSKHAQVAVLDFGSQFSHLICRRIRELNVYCEMHSCLVSCEALQRSNVKAIILSGGPSSVYEEGAPHLDPAVWAWAAEAGIPILGICYGFQEMTHALGGRVEAAAAREFGHAQLAVGAGGDPLFAGVAHDIKVWMSHGDKITALPPGFAPVASTPSCEFAAVAGRTAAGGRFWGLQFHPEVSHTPDGSALLANFVVGIAGCARDWTMDSFLEDCIANVRRTVGPTGRVIGAVSGGVDSTVAAVLMARAIGDRFHAVMVDNGLLRKGERADVVRRLNAECGVNLRAVDASALFLGRLAGVTDPERKRKIIGHTFIEVFEAEARAIGETAFLLQGTLYPDVIESVSFKGPSATIKSHHNVGGLLADMKLALIEPLRELFKDEVRALGRTLGLPEDVVNRHPFPGPGLAIRILGEVTAADCDLLREADDIFLAELRAAGEYARTGQAFAVLLPCRSVGVMGDARTYEKTLALRAVTTSDYMTADWARLPYDLLARVSSRVINEVRGINRVVYDITSKPPGTIEWE